MRDGFGRSAADGTAWERHWSRSLNRPAIAPQPSRARRPPVARLALRRTSFGNFRDVIETLLNRRRIAGEVRKLPDEMVVAERRHFVFGSKSCSHRDKERHKPPQGVAAHAVIHNDRGRKRLRIDREIGDCLRLAVFGDDEIVFGQSCDQLALGIPDIDRHDDQVYARPNLAPDIAGGNQERSATRIRKASLRLISSLDSNFLILGPRRGYVFSRARIKGL